MYVYITQNSVGVLRLKLVKSTLHIDNNGGKEHQQEGW